MIRSRGHLLLRPLSLFDIANGTIARASNLWTVRSVALKDDVFLGNRLIERQSLPAAPRRRCCCNLPTRYDMMRASIGNVVLGHCGANRTSHRAIFRYPWEEVGEGLITKRHSHQNHSQRTFSSTPYASPSKSLRKAIRPFLRACHPDAMSPRGESRDGLSDSAKEVNLKAVQTLNGLIDVLDDLIGRCIPPTLVESSGPPLRAGSTVPELKSRYEIEFVLSSSPLGVLDDGDDGNSQSKPARNASSQKDVLALRSVTVEFPDQLRLRVRQFALTVFPSNASDGGVDLQPLERKSFQTAYQLRQHALSEFVRLLNIAGLELPSSSAIHQSEDEGVFQTWSHYLNPDQRHFQQQHQHHGQDRHGQRTRELADHFLMEIGIDPVNGTVTRGDKTAGPSDSPPPNMAFFGRQSSSSAPPPPPHSSSHQQYFEQRHIHRQKFMNNLPKDVFKKLSEDYDNVVFDASADWHTMRMNLFNPKTKEGRERRERLVSELCGRVRVYSGPPKSHVTVANDDNSDDNNDRNDDETDRNDDETDRNDDNNNDNETDRNDDNNNDDETDDEEIPGLDTIEQLVAIRRLSLILNDNFDYLQMEEMGRMWERLVIVLTPPRPREHIPPDLSDYDDHDNHHRRSKSKKRRKLVKRWKKASRRRQKVTPDSRGRMLMLARDYFGDPRLGPPRLSPPKYEPTKKQRRQYESGFKFSYGTTSHQGSGHVTAYVPIDFRDDELIRQFRKHLKDYFDNVCSDYAIWGNNLGSRGLGGWNQGLSDFGFTADASTDDSVKDRSDDYRKSEMTGDEINNEKSGNKHDMTMKR